MDNERVKSSRLVVNVVGSANSGKTRLIRRLIPELINCGHSVGVVKHCSDGFDLDIKGKDSWQFMEAGSESIAMISRDQVAVLRNTVDKMDTWTLVETYFDDVDIVLVEGGRGDSDFLKIEVLRKGVSENIECSPNELLCVVTNLDVNVDKPTYHPDQIVNIASFLHESVQSRR